MSLAQIYRDLNFNSLAQVEAYNSLNKNFTNSSAHRFLAESLKDLSLNLASQSLIESNTGTLPNAGPGLASFNEYNSLFLRDNDAWAISTVIGNQQTKGDEIIYSTLFGNTVMNFSQYHYQTAGFRENNDFQQDIFSLFVKSAITPNQNLQFEFKSNDKEFGDLRLRFDPTNLSADRRKIREENSYRIGYTAKLTPNSRFLASFTYLNMIGISNDSFSLLLPPIGLGTVNSSKSGDFNTRSAELQYIIKKNDYQMVTGIGNYHQDQFQVNSFTSDDFVVAGPRSGDLSVNHSNAYFYNDFDFNSIDFTLGLSADDFDNNTSNTNQVNGKFGLLWDIATNIRLRAAAFRTLKRSLTTNQTIEPTQVAGFNQFYDDPLKADAINYGFAIDNNLNHNLYIGLEILHRFLDIPRDSPSSIFIERQKEYLDRFYLNWVINNNFSFTASYEFEEIKREIQKISAGNIPSKVLTKYVPLKLTYINKKQIFTGITATYVDQQVAQPSQITPLVLLDNADDFWILNFELGYRLPHRYGVLSFLINNVVDKKFSFQDVNFRTGLENIPRFSQNRTYLLKLTINID